MNGIGNENNPRTKFNVKFAKASQTLTKFAISFALRFR